MEQYDIVVIGSGPGGYVAAIRAAQLGMKVAVAERNELGGICLNWGCIPTKTLLKSAQAYHYAGMGNFYGFSAGDVKPDIGKMVARSRDVAAQMSRGIEFLFKKHGITLIKGQATILPDKNVRVEGDAETVTVAAKHIIVATGSRPKSLPFAPIDGEKIICYWQALVPDSIPKSMAVIGSGAIGSEFAFFYRMLGTEVTVIEFLDRIVPLEDDDVSAQLNRSFRKAGIKVMTSAQVKGVDTSSDMSKVTVETAKGTVVVEAEKVLSAVGVMPNTEFIGLEGLGVEMDRGKVVVDKWYKSSVDGIYAIGDIIPTPALAHVASAEAVCCVGKIAGIDVNPVDYDNIPACTYTSPEIASCGLSERKARERGIAVKTGKFPFTASGKAAAAGARDGFVKIVADAGTDEILGVHIIGENASEMIGGIVAARKFKIKASELASTIFPHPTMSEGIMEAAGAVNNEAVQI
ncbi:MAG: dihydrolipoyl dehydrogenase [Bacteroidales bacterium]|jgi:dihydrolipoamide dehydrogenase|nr:dihydrolipoyl dehydrogenase [Bacteroidales bacterium]MCI2121882.1 dihydrolipoyl dehydrogenase [Bacteroidales bacterium]MCI2145654.1 dihydrolipoyl dehydrogenase [Bacteroidales bacterium]